jgi:tetraacyldisaccharide 4'-kinase
MMSEFITFNFPSVRFHGMLLRVQETISEFERWASDVIFGRARGFRAFLTRWALRALSGIYRAVIQLRKYIFFHDYKERFHMGTLIISVGNITVGGTGKTPVVELLAKTLRDRQRKIAILSRGYKSKALADVQKWDSNNGKKLEADEIPKIVSTGRAILLDSQFAGDEPFMLAKNLDGVSVLVDRDRVKSARFAISQLEADTLILDDGFQYLRLSRGIDIVLVDANAPFGTGAMLPAGTLREPKKNLCRAHFIILTKSDGSDHAALIKKIRRYNRVAPIITTTHGPKFLENITTFERKPLDYLEGKHIAALSGIAVPENFENSLVKLGAVIEVKKRFSDHHRFSRREIERFTTRCLERDVQMIVTTEKDAVRYPRAATDDVPVWFLRIEVEILAGHEHWQHMIEQICQPAAMGNSILRNRTAFCG